MVVKIADGIAVRNRHFALRAFKVCILGFASSSALEAGKMLIVAERHGFLAVIIKSIEADKAMFIHYLSL